MSNLLRRQNSRRKSSFGSGSPAKKGGNFLQNTALKHVQGQGLDEVACEYATYIESEMAEVLIIYTGGTIGMAPGKNGYEPKIKRLADYLRVHSSFCDQEAPEFEFFDEDDYLITPESIYRRRTKYKVLEFDHLIDSSQIDSQTWIKIAKTVEEHYDDFDSFVILHGTDTMAYTASVLSFLLKNLNKAVIITGSQVPLLEMRNDATNNLLGALTIAGHYIIPEVCVYFNNKLFRGNRCIKSDNLSLDAFESPNYPPLVEAGIGFKVHWHRILTPSLEKFRVFHELDENVAVIRCNPLMKGHDIVNALREPTKAAILITFGMGNFPTNRSDLMTALSEANDRGVVIVNISECNRSMVSDQYEVGRELAKLGIIFGADLTFEAALAKLSYLLAKKYSVEKVRDRMLTNLRGEMYDDDQLKKHQNRTSSRDIRFIKQVAAALKLTNPAQTVRDFVPFYSKLVYINIATGNLEGLQNLDPRDTDFNAPIDEEGTLPLTLAIDSCNLDIVKFLVEEGVDVNRVDSDGDSPLYHSILNRSIPIARFLLDEKAHFSTTGAHTVLGRSFCEIAEEDNIELLKLISESGQSLNAFDYSGRGVGHIAVLKGNKELIELLKNTDYDFGHKDVLGFTPGSMAEYMKKEEISALLANINLKEE